MHVLPISWTRLALCLVVTLGPACSGPTQEDLLLESFATQIAAVDSVRDFSRAGNELTFTGPDGTGGEGAWRVRIDSSSIQAQDVENEPLLGFVRSSWFLDEQLVEWSDTRPTLPDPYMAAGIAQECYAVWDEASQGWGW